MNARRRVEMLTAKHVAQVIRRVSECEAAELRRCVSTAGNGRGSINAIYAAQALARGLDGDYYAAIDRIAQSLGVEPIAIVG